jgi:thioredoxin-dependent peroxiredoxin
MLKPNDPAPQFSLPDQNKQIHTLEEYKGKWLVVYFYPKDDTPGCTAEACSFRDQSEELLKAGLNVVGISKDTVGSHKKFAEKYNLNFTLLSDKTKKTIGAFGALGPKTFMGKEYLGILRTTFLIDPNGIIKKVYENVTPEQHAEQILKDLDLT